MDNFSLCRPYIFVVTALIRRTTQTNIERPHDIFYIDTVNFKLFAKGINYVYVYVYVFS